MTDESILEVSLEEYERILGEHGHRYVYYPKDIIQETFRVYLIQELQKALIFKSEGPVDVDEQNDNQWTRNKIEETVNRCIRGY